MTLLHCCAPRAARRCTPLGARLRDCVKSLRSSFTSLFPLGVGTYSIRSLPGAERSTVQGYLVHEKKPPPSRTTTGPWIFLLWGPRRGEFLMNEVPMYSGQAPPRLRVPPQSSATLNAATAACAALGIQGYLALRNTHPHRITKGPQA